MFSRLRKILSYDCGPFWQLAKYGAIGVMATCVQMAVFYAVAAFCLPCLASGDWAVLSLGLPPAEVSDAVRAFRFAVATAAGFAVANIFCWLMNRWFVFRPGRLVWYVEFGCFAAVSAVAMALATSVSGWLIVRFGMMTSLAALVEVAVSFVVNFAIRKFFIFKG